MKLVMSRFNAASALLALTTTICSWPTSAQGFPPTYTGRSGLSRTCYAPHAQTGQIVPVAGVNGSADGYWGFATYNNYGWPVIIFDLEPLSKVPEIVVRFTYYHECAHLATPTKNEIQANCIALKQMRRNGDLSAKDEAIVGEVTRSLGKLKPQYGDSGIAFWDATLQCAGNR
jgi:hypothetical protein